MIGNPSLEPHLKQTIPQSPMSKYHRVDCSGYLFRVDFNMWALGWGVRNCVISIAPSQGIGAFAQKRGWPSGTRESRHGPNGWFLWTVPNDLHHESEGCWAEDQDFRGHTVAGIKIDNIQEASKRKRRERTRSPPLFDQELHARTEHAQTKQNNNKAQQTKNKPCSRKMHVVSPV